MTNISDAIIEGLGDVLMQRVLLKILDSMPSDEADKLQELMKAENQEESEALIQKHIPNIAELVRQEVRAGVDEHKRLVTEALTKSAV